MRIILEIDDDVLTAAEALGRQQRQSLGKVISDLARRSLPAPMSRNGILLLPVAPGALPVTMEIVNALQDGTL